MVRKRHTGLRDLPGGDLRVGEHPEAGMRRIVESDSSAVVAITGLVGIYNRCTPRLSVVLRGVSTIWRVVEADQGVAVGEGPDDVGAVVDLPVEAFVGGVVELSVDALEVRG